MKKNIIRPRSTVAVINLVIRLWRELNNKRKRQFIFLIILVIISGTSEMLSLASVVPLIALYTKPEALYQFNFFSFLENFSLINSQLFITLVFIITVIFSTLTRLLFRQYNGRLAGAIGSEFGTKAFRQILFLSYQAILNINSSEIVATTTIYVNRVVSIIVNLLLFLSSIIISCGLIITLLLIEWKSTLASVIFLIICYFICSYSIKNIVFRNGDLMAKSQSKQVKIVQEGIGGIRDIILNSTQTQQIESYYKASSNFWRLNANNTFYSIFPRIVIEGLVLIGVVIYLYILSGNQNEFLDRVPLIATIALGLQKILPSMQQSYVSFSIITSAYGEVARIINIINKPIEYGSSYLNQYKKKENFVFQNLKIENCCFKFKKDSKNIIKIPFLEFKAGEKIGILGPSGSGKSTFIDILIGLLKPTTGKVLINDIDINDKNMISEKLKWQNSIAVVSQNIFLNDESIKKNIAFGKKDEFIDSKRVKEVAMQVNADRFIEELIYGYDTLVGERGTTLSGGQLQRIGLARALYKNSKVIIFDEATSALDINTEEKILKNIKSFYQDSMIIMISHRKESLNFCDKVYALKDKKLEII